MATFLFIVIGAMVLHHFLNPKKDVDSLAQTLQGEPQDYLAEQARAFRTNFAKAHNHQERVRVITSACALYNSLAESEKKPQESARILLALADGLMNCMDSNHSDLQALLLEKLYFNTLNTLKADPDIYVGDLIAPLENAFDLALAKKQDIKHLTFAWVYKTLATVSLLLKNKPMQRIELATTIYFLSDDILTEELPDAEWSLFYMELAEKIYQQAPEKMLSKQAPDGRADIESSAAELRKNFPNIRTAHLNHKLPPEPKQAAAASGAQAGAKSQAAQQTQASKKSTGKADELWNKNQPSIETHTWASLSSLKKDPAQQNASQSLSKGKTTTQDTATHTQNSPVSENTPLYSTKPAPNENTVPTYKPAPSGRAILQNPETATNKWVAERSETAKASPRVTQATRPVDNTSESEYFAASRLVTAQQQEAPLGATPDYSGAAHAKTEPVRSGSISPAYDSTSTTHNPTNPIYSTDPALSKNVSAHKNTDAPQPPRTNATTNSVSPAPTPPRPAGYVPINYKPLSSK